MRSETSSLKGPFGRSCLVWAQNSASITGVTRTGWGAAEDVGYRCDLGAAVIEWYTRAILRKCQSVWANTAGSTYCGSARGTPRKSAKPVAPSDHMAEDANEEDRGRPVAKSDQMAPGARQKLIWVAGVGQQESLSLKV